MQRRVLIVDDEPETCELILKVVNSVGMEALTVTDSSQAAAFLSEGKFDLVFFDFHMRSPDGVELARQMRLSRPNRTTPVILISDDQRPSALGIGFEAGASFFLYKPIDRERLMKLVRATQGSIEHERRRTRRIAVRHR
jgi:CheY-like chemotaxis protein